MVFIKLESPYLPEVVSIVDATFSVQPPTNVRKLTFFSFTISFFIPNRRPLPILESEFIDLIDRRHSVKPPGNGLEYTVRYQDSTTNRIITQPLFVRLIDSESGQLIHYEGVTKNPDLQHVLLNHESACNRCTGMHKCGNQMGTPSDPVILKPNQLQFFVRCNQNCIRGTGAPMRSQTKRHFSIQVSSQTGILGTSLPIFVHNSSKVGCKVVLRQRNVSEKLVSKKGKSDIVASGKPCRKAASSEPIIKFISPNVALPGTTLTLIGENFIPHLEACFGNIIVPVEWFICGTALSVKVPADLAPGCVRVTLRDSKTNYVHSVAFTCKDSLAYRLRKLVSPQVGNLPSVGQSKLVQQIDQMVNFRSSTALQAEKTLPVSTLQYKFENVPTFSDAPFINQANLSLAHRFHPYSQLSRPVSHVVPPFSQTPSTIFQDQFNQSFIQFSDGTILQQI